MVTDVLGSGISRALHLYSTFPNCSKQGRYGMEEKKTSSFTRANTSCKNPCSPNSPTCSESVVHICICHITSSRTAGSSSWLSPSYSAETLSRDCPIINSCLSLFFSLSLSLSLFAFLISSLPSTCLCYLQ